MKSRVVDTIRVPKCEGGGDSSERAEGKPEKKRGNPRFITEHLGWDLRVWETSKQDLQTLGNDKGEGQEPVRTGCLQTAT